MKIFAGSSNKPLAERIAKHLRFELSPLEIHVFPDGEKRVQIQDSVVDEDVIVVQSTAMPVDKNYMELFFLVDAFKRSGAKSITAVAAYLGYQRQDHVFREGEARSFEVVAETLEMVGMSRLITFDLHSIKLEQLFTVPVHHLSALPLFAEQISPWRSHMVTPPRWPNGLLGGGLKDSVLVTPDMGGVRRIKQLSKMLGGVPFASIVKNRDLATGDISSQEIQGEVGKRVIIVDDMISSGKTIIGAVKLLKKHGAEEIFVFAPHPVFSNDAAKILQDSPVEKVFVTDTIDVPDEKHFPKLHVLSVAKMVAKEIKAPWI